MPSVVVELKNPVCGDEISLYLKVEEGVVQACALRAGLLHQPGVGVDDDRGRKGKPLAEALELVERFKGMVRGEISAAKPTWGISRRCRVSPSFPCGSNAPSCRGKPSSEVWKAMRAG